LISLDLDRGRDFGIPSYNKFRQLCGLAEAKTFDDLTDQIDQKVSATFLTLIKLEIIFLKHVDALAGLYENVNDVDYYAAGLLEKSKPGAIFGHTFQCVIGEMFFRWKFGDRFYYEFGDQPGSFTLGKFFVFCFFLAIIIICSACKSIWSKCVGNDKSLNSTNQKPLFLNRSTYRNTENNVGTHRVRDVEHCVRTTECF